ncbi:uncharacterized protein B0H18DRAFT_51001 [Fomitopsis serialis]|uniref:uncharacterized protein n=1 Tax=Fomitopsis serialis TaxID=139415 RepID=UPI002007AD7C|nr:uncharacterized protein B0H18DRAFT_51001 [Neoantrodia serialis]KAH9932221.1 hypothetical protein B0H18DRAFT_51001 [Neoantrodia serialis]
MPGERPRYIIVLGAGVAGLTTALAIQEKATYQVSVIAETFQVTPNDQTTRVLGRYAVPYPVFNRLFTQISGSASGVAHRQRRERSTART